MLCITVEMNTCQPNDFPILSTLHVVLIDKYLRAKYT